MLKLSVSLSNLFGSISSSLRRDDRGVTAVEYGLLVALIAVVIIVAVTLLGTNLRGIFSHVATTIN